MQTLNRFHTFILKQAQVYCSRYMICMIIVENEIAQLKFNILKLIKCTFLVLWNYISGSVLIQLRFKKI